MLKLWNSDARLVRSVLAGDREQYGALVEKYMQDAMHVAAAHCGNWVDAEDVCQEAFLKGFLSLDQLQDPERFKYWLLTIVRRVAYRSREQKRREARGPESIDGQPQAAAHPAQQKEREALVLQMLQELPPEKREVLLLHYFGGRSAREIAGLLNLNREAVKKRLERARTELGAQLLTLLPAEERQGSQRELLKKVMAAVLAAKLTYRPAAASAAAGELASITASKLLLSGGAVLLLAAGAAVGKGMLHSTQAASPSVEVEVADTSAPTRGPRQRRRRL